MPKSKILGVGHLQLLISEIFQGFFSENQDIIVKNRQNTKIFTVPKWQDFEIFKKH